MKNINHCILVVVFSFMIPAIVFAEEKSQSVDSQEISLDQVRAHALVYSLGSKKIDRDIGNQLAEALQIKRLKNPVINIGGSVPDSYSGSRPSNEYRISLNHPLRISDLGLRSKVSELMTKVTNRENKKQLRELIQQISLAYYSLWALRQERSHIRDQQNITKRIAGLINDAEAQGLSTAAEVKISVANMSRIKAELLGVEHDISRAERVLTELAAVRLKGKKLKRPEIKSLRSFEEMLAAARLNKHSLGERSALDLQLANKQLELAKTDAFPTFLPRVAYYQNDEGNKFVEFGLAVPLPLYNRNQEEIQKKKNDVSYLNRRRQYINGEEFEIEFRALYDQVKAKTEQALIYEKEVIPPLKESVLLSEEALANAQIRLLDLWNVQKAFHESIDYSTELWIEAYRGLAQLSLITGELEL